MKTSSGEGTIMSSAPENGVHKLLIDSAIPIEDLLGSVTTYNNVDGSESLQLRTSARVFKKMKLDSALAALPDKKVPDKKEEAKCEPAKKPLPKPFWSIEEKNYFFDALNEFGKDFEAIHNYINNKLRKKYSSEAILKTREQIRHLYYRTWNKISKHLKFSKDVKRVVQELYALINYGELRKKMTFGSVKTSIKFHELIYRGSVVIRIKGRTIRLRTPMCKALRKLNQIEETNEEIQLPPRVLVECIPRDMATWMTVQEMSQNPRLRTTVPLQRRLTSLIDFLTHKWRTCEMIEADKLRSLGEVVGDIDELVHIQSNNTCFRLTPPKNAAIVVPTFTITEFFTTQSICLNAYEERIGSSESGEALWMESYPSIKHKKNMKRMRTESSSAEKSCSSGLQLHAEAMPSDNMDELIDEAVNTLLQLKKYESVAKMEKVEPPDREPVIKEEAKRGPDVPTIRSGWTIGDCGTLTVGDLYLMFGSESKVQLEYGWDSHHVNSNVTTTLKQLLSVAKLHYRKNVVKCPCGHVCGSPSKSQSKAKLAARLPKQNSSEIRNVDAQTATSMVTIIQQNINATTTAGMVPVIIQPDIREFSPQSLFRRPTSPNPGLRSQINSLQRLLPKYCNRKGRPRTKQVVVERTLPLLANHVESSRIMQMNIMSPQELRNVQAPRLIAPKIEMEETKPDLGAAADCTDNATSFSRVSSPTCIVKVEPSPDMQYTEEPCDLPTSPRQENCITSFVGMLPDSKRDMTEVSTPPASPMRILKENENQWINAEVADFSFSSFLGHLEMPSKSTLTGSSSTAANEDTRMSLSHDMDAHLQSLFSETSIDYTAKFADLAAQMITDYNK